MQPMLRTKIYKILFLLCLFFHGYASAMETEERPEKTWKDEFLETWHSETWECVVPVNTWHNRWTYDRKKVREFNERPWGIGIGKYRYDENGNRHSVVGLTFQDSHNSPEPTFGYAWQKMWRKDKLVQPGLGLMGGISFRKDYNWIPIPAVLPIFSVDIGPFSLENTYIPSLSRNSGNVLFTWITWRF